MSGIVSGDDVAPVAAKPGGGRLAGKVAIVTGAGAGIGEATSLAMAREGARVVLADVLPERVEALATRIAGEGGEVLCVPIDVTDEAAWASLVETVLERHGRIDALFNNAGGGSPSKPGAGRDGSVVDLDLDEFWRVVRVDLFGTLLGCRHVLPVMAKAGSGSVINIASLRAVMGTRGGDAYTAAKGGVLALSRALAVQWAESGIRVNTLAPGVVLSDRVRAMIPPEDPIYRKMLLGPAEPVDVAELVVYLASDESRRMTGAVLRLDGGASAA